MLRVALGMLCLSAFGQPLSAQQKRPAWREFHAETLKITFRHPSTAGLSIVTRLPSCTASDSMWQGDVADSMLVVTRSLAQLKQVAANLGIVRTDAGWIAQGYEGRKAPVASLRVRGWEALVTDQATTVVFDEALRSPVTARQWRLIAMGPATDGCRPLLLGIATGLAAVWDSSTVAKVLESASPRH